jgi:hypothetical protein
MSREIGRVFQVIELLAGALLDGLIDPWLDRGAQRRRIRRWAKAYAQGEDVAFLGYAAGPVSYRPRFGDRGGAFVLSSGELFWTVDPQLGRSLWHRVPNQRLHVQHRTQGLDSSGQDTWPGYECLDQDRTVILLCEPGAERYLRAALFLPELPDQPVIDARVDPEFWASRTQGAAPSTAGSSKAAN